jgi:hypothetical protein
VKDDLAASWRQVRLDMVEHGLRRSNAVNSDDLVSSLSAASKDVLEDALLRIE